MGYTVERWADEDAAHTTRDRPVVAHAVGRAALASSHAGAGATTRPALGLGISPALPADAGEVPRRVAALLADPIRTVRRTWLIAAVAVVLLAALATVEAQQDFEALLELARHAVVG